MDNNQNFGGVDNNTNNDSVVNDTINNNMVNDTVNNGVVNDAISNNIVNGNTDNGVVNNTVNNNTYNNEMNSQGFNNNTTINPYQGFNNGATFAPNPGLNSGSTQKNGSIVKIVAILLLVVVIGVAGFFGYQYYMKSHSPKTKVLKSTAKFLQSNAFVSDGVDVVSYLENGFTTDFDANVKVYDKTEELFDFGIDGNVANNIKNKQSYYSLNFKSGSDYNLNFTGLAKDDKLYFKIKDLFDKFYFTDFPYEQIYNTGSEKLVNDVIDGIVESIAEEKFVSSKETKTINNESMNVQKISLELKTSELSDIALHVLEKVKNDEEALKFLVTEENTLDDIKSDIDDYIKEIKDGKSNITDDDVIFTYNTYFKGNECVMFDITVYEGFVVTVEGNETGSFSVKYEDEEFVKGTFNTNELNITFPESNASVKIGFKEEKITNGVKDIYNVELIIEDTKVVFDLTISVNNSVDIPNVDLTGAKDIDDITEEEGAKIEEKLLELPFIKDYMSRLNSAVGNYDYSYSDYDYSSYDFNTDYDYSNYDFNTTYDYNDYDYSSYGYGSTDSEFN